ncbi:hypothetical protein [Spirosoma gilvum]
MKICIRWALIDLRRSVCSCPKQVISRQSSDTGQPSALFIPAAISIDIVITDHNQQTVRI